MMIEFDRLDIGEKFYFDDGELYEKTGPGTASRYTVTKHKRVICDTIDGMKYTMVVPQNKFDKWGRFRN